MTTPRGGRSRVALSTQVRRTEHLTPSMIRLVLAGGDLARFRAAPFTDSYVKIVFLDPDVAYPRPLDMSAVREQLPAEHQPRLRTYTVRDWDEDAHELTLDVVVHAAGASGSAGLAGPWAQALQPGDEVLLVGPGGEYAPDPAADWHLFAGDESALPAIAVALAALPSNAQAHAFLEVEGPADEVDLDAPAAARVTWLHRNSRPVGELLVDAVTGLQFPTGRVHAFVHGEAGFVKELRRVLRVDRGLAKEQLSISGYWRVGADDEGWRAAKRQWNAEAEAAEQAAGVA
jgi:NADPH-dependent ferric siderophore reductase